MSRMTRVAAAAAALLVVIARPLPAQQPVAQLPPEYGVGTVDEWFPETDRETDERWRERVAQRFATQLADGLYLQVLEQLAGEFRASAWPSHQDVKAKFQIEFDALVERYRTALIAAGLEDGLRTTEQRSSVLEAMGDRGAESLRPQQAKIPVTTSVGPMDFDVQFFFLQTPSEIQTATINGDGLYVPLVPVELVRDMRLRGHAVWSVLKHFVAPIQNAQLNAIRDANVRWDNYMKNGYSQLPWEALLNGAVLNFHAFDPPDKQWIIVHPSLGLEFSTAAFKTTEFQEALNLEILGFIAYFGEQGKNFMGASASIMMRDDLGPGIGPVVHFAKNMSLGVAWHDTNDNDKLDDPPFVFMTVDLFRFLDTESSKFKAEMDKVKTLAANAGLP